MSCTNCGSTKDGKPAGCKSNGHCATGGCNKLNTFDWLADIPLYGDMSFDIVEVSFNQGARKGFYRKREGISVDTGDWVAVDAKFGYDIGKITLSGELVKLQMRKKRIRDNDKIPLIQRRATEKDLQKAEVVKAEENAIMVRSRAIARQLGLDMKIGQVEVQGDGKKVTFYYTADERVDFRQLIKEYASEFKMKIEMRQIGARQEAGKIGGLGSCGRELCCSTWLTDFKSVSTSAARYQNLAINQSKLSGQCGRLKCCLNYELDTYMDALKAFPDNADKLETAEGTAYLQKTDIFKQWMYYAYKGKSTLFKLSIEEVNKILALNKKGEKPDSLIDRVIPEKPAAEVLDFGDTDEVISLEQLEKRERHNKRKKRRKKNRRKGGSSGGQANTKGNQNKPNKSPRPRGGKNNKGNKGNDTSNN